MKNNKTMELNHIVNVATVYANLFNTISEAEIIIKRLYAARFDGSFNSDEMTAISEFEKAMRLAKNRFTPQEAATWITENQ